MKTTLTRLLVLATLFTGAMMAQRNNPGGGTPPDPATMIQRRVQMLTQQLGLSDSQASQATSIFTSEQSAASPIQASLRTARQSLATAVKANDTGGIDTVSASVGTLTAQLTAVESKANAAFYAILTADQKSKVDQRGGSGGFGPGPGGMGMGRGGFGQRPPRQ